MFFIKRGRSNLLLYHLIPEHWAKTNEGYGDRIHIGLSVSWNKVWIRS